MTKRLLLLLIFCDVNLAAQSVVDGVFAVFTFKREIFHKEETFYWITPQDSILSHDNGRFCIYPLYLASEETVSWSDLVNENGDPESSLPFCKKVLANQEKVQTIRSTHRTVIYKSKPKEKTLTEKTSVYLTFVSGRFLIGEVQSNNMINRYYPIKAYSPIGEIIIVKKEKNDRIYRAAKMTDYQGIAFSITQLASYPFNRENSKAYQEPYQQISPFLNYEMRFLIITNPIIRKLFEFIRAEIKLQEKGYGLLYGPYAENDVQYWLEFPGTPLGTDQFVLICLSVSSCGITKRISGSNIHEFNTVEIPPKYKGEQWQVGLLRDFNSRMIYPLDNDEQIQTGLTFQFVITKEGHLINAVILGKDEIDLSLFEKEGLKVLRRCQSWTPAQNNGRAVNVLMTFIVRY